MSRLQEALSDSLYLTGYDVIKPSIKSKKLMFPSFQQVGNNVVGASGYQFIGKPIMNMFGNQFPNTVLIEKDVIGKFIGVPVFIMASESLMGGSSAFGELFVKSLLSLGAKEVINRSM